MSKKYRYWTSLTAFCFERKCRCEGCCEANVACKIKPIKRIPYGMRPIKYAVLQTFANIGLDGYKEALDS